jgi:hypothetical protein
MTASTIRYTEIGHVAPPVQAINVAAANGVRPPLIAAPICHRGKRLIWQMVVDPGEDPACGRQKSLAGLRLQATHTAQMIKVGSKQWAIRVRRRPATRS